jgi:hypothetical protein
MNHFRDRSISPRLADSPSITSGISCGDAQEATHLKEQDHNQNQKKSKTNSW